jgi:uncharacterized damage-inducible protein DinB
MSTEVSTEHADLLETLEKHRSFLRYTVRDLSDEQADQRTTISELCLGGLIKHVAAVESRWIDFILEGPAAFAAPSTSDEDAVAAYRAGFQMLPGETLDDLLATYAKVAARTSQVIGDLANLDHAQPLPDAPWFEKGAHWSARRVLLHIIAETAQHAGHADILREALDGSKTMG